MTEITTIPTPALLAEIEAVRACGEAPELLWWLEMEARKRDGKFVLRWEVDDIEGLSELVAADVGEALLTQLSAEYPGVRFWVEGRRRENHQN